MLTLYEHRDHVIGETSIIIEHVAGAELVPSLEARLWDRLCDQYVSDSVQQIVALFPLPWPPDFDRYH